VYLAESSEDLDEERDSVREYLLHENVTVLTPNQFSAAPTQYRAELQKVLRRNGIVFAQLLSGSLGRLLAEDDDTTHLVHFQYKIALGQRVPIYQWRNRSVNLKEIANNDHHKMLLGSNVNVGTLDEFKALLVAGANASPARVIVIFDDVDDYIARFLLEVLRDMSLTTCVAGTTDTQDSLELKLRICEALVFIYGAVPAQRLIKSFKTCMAIIRRRLEPIPAVAILDGPPHNKTPLEFDFLKPESINNQAGFDAEKIRAFFEFLPSREE